MRISEQIELAGKTTLGIGGPARYWAEAEAAEDVPAALAWARERGLEWLVVAGGSNLLVSDAGFAGLALHPAFTGIAEIAPGVAEVAAGHDWDGFVAWCVARGWAGVECMSGIPGTAGATPVQNVGAYGQEVAEVIEQVRAWDAHERRWATMSAAECGFSYRSSRFNRQDRGRFVITAVRFRLRPGGAATVRYPELERRLAESRGGERTLAPTLEAVREAVRALRRGKAMLLEAGDADCRSAGSFFKNPVVDAARVAAVAAAAGAAPPQFAAGDGRFKLPAAWLIERAGFGKGFALADSRVGLSSRHVLALVNRGGGTAAEAMALAGAIQNAVAQRFGVALEPEPVRVGF
ncbi:MAG: UDP-N-acetylmuramate dehydrogenase [Terriglobales bacterium]